MSKINTNETNFILIDENKVSAHKYVEIEDIDRIIEKSVESTLRAKNFASSNKSRLQIWLLSLLSVVVVVNSYFVFSFINKPADAEVLAQNDSVVASPKISSLPGKKEINQFYGNVAITEIGAKVKATKDQISTDNHSNCKTPILPPEDNGCDFNLAPSLIGLPKRGVKLTSFEVYGSIQGSSQIQVDVKNYEKNNLDASLAKIETAELGQKFYFPENFENSKGLYFRLWQKEGNITINRIVINYFYIENMIPVSGKINKFTNPGNYLGYIYWDRNDDGMFQSDSDKLQTCSVNFPGVLPFKLSSTNEFILKRDDQCYSDSKSDSWFTDNQSNVLPPGKWIILLDDGKDKKTLSFEIDPSSQKTELDLSLK